MIKLQDIGELEIMDEISKIEEFEKEMMILSGFALGARNMFTKDTDIFNSVKYNEYRRDIRALENNGIIRELNDHAFWSKPEPTPRKKWYH